MSGAVANLIRRLRAAPCDVAAGLDWPSVTSRTRARRPLITKSAASPRAQAPMASRAHDARVGMHRCHQNRRERMRSARALPPPRRQFRRQLRRQATDTAAFGAIAEVVNQRDRSSISRCRGAAVARWASRRRQSACLGDDSSTLCPEGCLRRASPRDLDLQLARIHRVLGRHTKPRRRDCLMALLRSVPKGIFAALAAVAAPAWLFMAIMSV